jgi:hypothetical protein
MVEGELAALATSNQAAPIESGGPCGVPPSRTKLARGRRVIEPAPLTAHAKVAPARVTWDGQKAIEAVALGLKKTILRRAGLTGRTCCGVVLRIVG